MRSTLFKHYLKQLTLLLLLASGMVSAAKPPNIVLIMADDLGYGDISYYNERIAQGKSHVRTPTIDALAKGGMWFTDAHSPTALCSPSRYSVMSGNNTYHSYRPWGVWSTFRESPFKKADLTIGRVAKAAGYRTGFIGKWHLGGAFREKGSEKIYRGNDKREPNLKADLREWVAGHPRDMGFDYDFTVPTGVQGPLYLAYENNKWYPLSSKSKIIYVDKTTARDPVFVSDKGPGMGDSEWNAAQLNVVLAKKAKEFIENSQGKQPFLLNYWSPAVHIPHTPPATLDGKKIAGSTVSPHLDMVRVLDYEVKVIVDALKKTGTLNNTLIIFSSDNGGLGNKGASKVGHNSAGKLRGHKNQPYEGGHRTPFIAYWPNKIRAGSQNDAMVSGTDLIATIAAVSKVDIKENQAMDSWNLLPFLLEEKNAPRRKEMLLQGGSRNQLIYREGNWKLIIQTDPKLSFLKPTELYDLTSNPRENQKRNLINDEKQAKRVQRMFERYQEIRNSKMRTAPLS